MFGIFIPTVSGSQNGENSRSAGESFAWMCFLLVMSYGFDPVRDEHHHEQSPVGRRVLELFPGIKQANPSHTQTLDIWYLPCNFLFMVNVGKYTIH